jgi:hypothetical protein
MFGNKNTQVIYRYALFLSSSFAGYSIFSAQRDVKDLRCCFGRFLHSTVAGKEGMEGTPALLKAITV